MASVGKEIPTGVYLKGDDLGSLPGPGERPFSCAGIKNSGHLAVRSNQIVQESADSWGRVDGTGARILGIIHAAKGVATRSPLVIDGSDGLCPLG